MSKLYKKQICQEHIYLYPKYYFQSSYSCKSNCNKCHEHFVLLKIVLLRVMIKEIIAFMNKYLSKMRIKCIREKATHKIKETEYISPLFGI